jgi:hypothetical protein
MAEENGRGPSWLSLYLERTQDMESPSIFHKWVAVATVGQVLGRRVWLSKEGNYAVFPGQLMVCLVAASAKLRKSTAVNIGGRLLDAVATKLGRATFNRISDKCSPSSFLDQLHPEDEMGVKIEDADCVGTIVAPELATFFSRDSYNEPMATEVVPINDAPVGDFDDETLGFGPTFLRSKFRTKTPVELRNPCIGLIAATTPTGLAREIPTQAQTAGLFGRVIWVYAQDTDKKPNAMTRLRPRIAGAHQRLQAELVEMAKLAGAVRYQTDARKHYEAWYERWLPTSTMGEETNFTTGFHGRKHDHVLRVAIVLAAMDRSVSKRGGGLVLQLPHIKASIQLLNQVERQLPLCFAEIRARGQVSLETRILQMLARKPDKWFPRLKIVQRMWSFRTGGEGNTKAPAVDQALAQLTLVEHIRKRGEGTKAEYKFKRTPGSMLRLAKEAETEPVDEEDEEG